VKSSSDRFEEVAAELSRPLLHYLEAFVGDRTMAEDLVQETLIRISKGLDAFRGEASLKTWAFSIATRVASDHFRKPENRLRIVGVDEAEEATAFPDPGAAADEVAVLKEMNACIRQVIDSLPEGYRAPLILHCLEGLSIAETAAICESPVPATKIRIHRARRRLEEALRAQCNLYHDSRNVLRCDRVP
jgi:RNA polymerase sigma-70 factor, ECF subfamily